mmetsp:Transcript_1167/g.2681  ORF Transcript_1167/g.2681 Transcript_1167/m.2681 type:complete len:619 (+) Transcript_1167:216-2072(+)
MRDVSVICVVLLICAVGRTKALGCPEFSTSQGLKCQCVSAVYSQNGTIAQNGFYQLQRGPCRKCPVGAECIGADHLPYPKPGYWGSKACPATFAPCLRSGGSSGSSLCLGGPEFECFRGHQGTFCHGCAQGYGRADGSSWCGKCAKLWKQAGMWVVKLLYQTALVLSIIFTELAAEKRNKPETTQLVKILSHYMEIASLIFASNVSWPLALKAFAGNLPPSGEVYSFDCWLNPSEHKALYSWALQLTIPLLTFIIVALFMFCYSLSLTKKVFFLGKEPKKGSELLLLESLAEKKKHLSTTPLGTSGVSEHQHDEEYRGLGFFKSCRGFSQRLLPRVVIVSIYTLWPSMCKTMLTAFSCRQFPSTFLLTSACDDTALNATMRESVWLWNHNNNVACFTGGHAVLLGSIMVPWVVVVAFPLLIYKHLRNHHAKLYVDNRFDYTFGFLYRDYERKYWWWEAAILARTLSIVMAVCLFGGHRGEMLALVILLIIFVSALAHEGCMPYVSDFVDRAERVSLVVAFLLVMCTLWLRLDIPPSAKEALGAVALLCHLSLFLAIGLFYLFVVLRDVADKDKDNVVTDEEIMDYFSPRIGPGMSRKILTLFVLFRLVETNKAKTKTS